MYRINHTNDSWSLFQNQATHLTWTGVLTWALWEAHYVSRQKYGGDGSLNLILSLYNQPRVKFWTFRVSTSFFVIIVNTDIFKYVNYPVTPGHLNSLQFFWCRPSCIVSILDFHKAFHSVNNQILLSFTILWHSRNNYSRFVFLFIRLKRLRPAKDKNYEFYPVWNVNSWDLF